MTISLANDSSVNKSSILLKPLSEEKSNYCGDNQYNKVGERIKTPIRVKVINKKTIPVPNFPVKFKIISFPYKSKGQYLEDTIVYTDSSGIAENFFYFGSHDGQYEVLANIQSDSDKTFQVFKLFARKSNWVFILIIGLIGGLGLFLFGMNLLSGGLQKSAGDRMRSILSTLTYNRFIAVFVGIFTTVITQSSSATTVMLVSFVNSRLIRFRQSIGIFLGAAIGTTITVQIIAFKLSDYSLLMIGIGFGMYIISKGQKFKHIGEALLGFGVLFFGMHIMSKSMYPLRSYQPFIDMILTLENPLLGILIGTALTALIQSSAAFIGIIIILAGQGFISLAGSIPLLLGANIGTAITAILASINSSRESKQVALAHTLFKITGVLILIWWIPEFVRIIESISLKNILPGEPINTLSERLPRQIANAHTVFNIILALIFLPFTISFSKVVNKILPCKIEELFHPKTKYLNDSLIKTPSLALSEAKQEVLRMINIIKKMTRDIIFPFMEKDVEILKRIEQRGEEINFLKNEINTYLLKIAREKISSKMAREIYQMMFAVKEFEQIGDIISTTLKQHATNWCNDKSDFSSKGKKEILEYHSLTIKQITRASNLYKKFDLKKAKKMKLKYEENRDLFIELEKQHYKRLKKEVEKSVESSKTHLELMTMLKLINSHITNTARILLQ